MDKDYKYTGYNPKSKEKARILRKNMTPQEKKLWYGFLRDYPVKFYRQRSIDVYIVDFYCSKANLVIEIDGSQHYTTDGMEYDIIRTEILEQYSLEVIRFSNWDIDNKFNIVCTCIDKKVKEKTGKKNEIQL